MEKRKSGIYISPGRKPWPHEMFAAEVLALAGHYVEFLREGDRPSADIWLDGVAFEIQSPEAFNTNTFEHTLKDATKQSPNIIINMIRMKKVREQKVRMFLVNQMKKQKQIKRLLLISKSGQIIDISTLI